mgnify:CR=1 FL=1
MLKPQIQVLLTVAVLVASCSSASAVLIGHWKLDEGVGTTAADSSGLGNDATRSGAGGSWVTSGAPAGNAFEFPGGGGNYFEASLGAALPIGAAERTITAWINPDQNSQDRKFLGYGTSGSGLAFNFTVEDNGIRFRHGGGNITYGGGLVTPGNWYHVAMRVNSGASVTGDVDVFINGVQASITGTASGGTGVTLNTPSSSFRIGNNFQNNSFDGSIDDVQFYNTALSDADIPLLSGNPGLSLNDLGNPPVTILSTDFTGRTVSGSTASNITWVTNGVADPGDLTAAMNPDGLFDTAAAQGRFAPDRNIHNEGDWSVDIPLLVGPSAINLTTIELDAVIFNTAGALQPSQRDVDLTLQLLDASMAILDSVSVLDIYANSGTATQPQAILFDLSGNSLLAGGSYFLRLIATGQGPGNNAGFDNLVVTGILTSVPVPEPGTVTFGLLALGGLILRRRRAA